MSSVYQERDEEVIYSNIAQMGEVNDSWSMILPRWIERSSFYSPTWFFMGTRAIPHDGSGSIKEAREGLGIKVRPLVS